MHQDQYSVFLVDDSDDDRLFMRMALERSSKLKIIGEACDGEEAIDYLKGNGPFKDRQAHPLADLLLLDLKMPRKDGFDVLQWLQNHKIEKMTVVITSGSCLAEDVARSTALGADGYFKKTSVRAEQVSMVLSLEELVAKKSRLVKPTSR